MLERRNEGTEELVCIIAYKRASFVISGGLSIINPIRACLRPSGQEGGGGRVRKPHFLTPRILKLYSNETLRVYSTSEFVSF